MENGKDQISAKAIKVIPSTIPNEKCNLPPIYNNITKRKQKLFCAYIIHHKMLLTIGYDPP